MRTRKNVLLFLIELALLTSVGGCGTIITNIDVDGEGKHGLIYSGIRFDYRGAFDPSYMQHIPFGKPLCIIDMPLSLVCDTIVLPYTGLRTIFGKGTSIPEDVSDKEPEDKARNGNNQRR